MTKNTFFFKCLDSSQMLIYYFLITLFLITFSPKMWFNNLSVNEKLISCHKRKGGKLNLKNVTY